MQKCKCNEEMTHIITSESLRGTATEAYYCEDCGRLFLQSDASKDEWYEHNGIIVEDILERKDL